VLGLLLEAPIKRYLFGVWPVAAAWLVGGVFILLIFGRRSATDGKGIEGLTWKAALLIGVAQAAALWPGVSRSLVTIAGGLLAGLSLSAAVEWSFLLGLVTLGAATVYGGTTVGPEIVRTFGVVSPLIGVAVAAASAFLAARWMVGYVKTRGLAVFGWYRIGAAVLTGLLAS
jgi:undecaprenyl-diphosphatase